MQKISPFLWFENQAEEAAKYYVSLFKNSKMGKVTRYPKGTPLPEGSVMTATFVIEGQDFTAMNGGPTYKFTPAISFVVYCDDQAEVDRLWDQLSEGGQTSQCGWLQDRFGVSWQIVPRVLQELLRGGGDEARGRRVMTTMLAMEKLEIKPLEDAYNATP